MLLIEKMKDLEKITESQKAVIDFMITRSDKLETSTSKQIAESVFTSPATLTRLSKKLGYRGFEELKKDFLREQEYLDKNKSTIDANFPFHKHDNMKTIANSIGKLIKESIDDTLYLLNYDELQSAIDIICKAETIHISAISFSLIYARDFQLKMRRLGKNVEITELVGEQLYTFPMIKEHDCAMMISYSGEIPLLKQMAALYREKKVPVISITSLGENTIRKFSNVVIDVTTREKLYSKISGFSSQSSIRFVLDILYSCYFELQYHENLHRAQELGKRAEPGRCSTSQILDETFHMK